MPSAAQRAHLSSLKAQWSAETALGTDARDRGMPDSSWWVAPDARTRDGFKALLAAQVSRMAHSKFAKQLKVEYD
jgi:hypothetical protein